MTLYEFDQQARIINGYPIICGVDEAGRGPLAGRVYAAAVILPCDSIIEGINDSKKLTEKKRELLYDIILETAVDFGVGWADEKEIDQINILQASMLAMRRAAQQLTVKPDLYLIDGNRHPQIPGLCKCEVKGDANSACIAAASILAKVSRDRYMAQQALLYPDYDFSQHKGYGTALHYEKLAAFGPCPIHRVTFLKNIDRAPRENRGKRGEDIAAQYIIDKGYTILERNARSPYGEIDIIAYDNEYILFIEVKQRNNHAIDRPAAWVDQKKQNKILKTAYEWLQQHHSNLQPSFDIIEVTTSTNNTIINHIENAFLEGETL